MDNHLVPNGRTATIRPARLAVSNTPNVPTIGRLSRPARRLAILSSISTARTECSIAREIAAASPRPMLVGNAALTATGTTRIHCRTSRSGSAAFAPSQSRRSLWLRRTTGQRVPCAHHKPRADRTSNGAVPYMRSMRSDVLRRSVTGLEPKKGSGRQVTLGGSRPTTPASQVLANTAITVIIALSVR